MYLIKSLYRAVLLHICILLKGGAFPITIKNLPFRVIKPFFYYFILCCCDGLARGSDLAHWTCHKVAYSTTFKLFQYAYFDMLCVCLREFLQPQSFVTALNFTTQALTSDETHWSHYECWAGSHCMSDEDASDSHWQFCFCQFLNNDFQGCIIMLWIQYGTKGWHFLPSYI